MFTVGLTGGIGSGKSTVSKLFKDLGVTVADADQIAHRLVVAGSPTLQAIVDAFGSQLLDQEGALDRAALRALIFNDKGKKARLESIMHPRVYAAIRQTLDAGTSIYGIADIPLLIETKHQDEVDRILVVDCSESTQIERVRRRNQFDDAQIEGIMRSQCSRAERLAWATDVILNEGDLISLKEQVEQHHQRFLALASAVD